MSSDSARQSGNAQAKNTKEFEVQTYWFVARGDVLMGPFNSTQVADRLKTREFSAFDFCWREGFQEWRPVSSVDEFERRGKMKSLSPYPKIEIPSAPTRFPSINEISSPTPSPVDQVPENLKNSKSRFRLVGGSSGNFVDREKSERRKIEVSFSRVKKSPLSIYEWTLALGLTLGFAFFTSQFALQEVENALNSRLRFIEAGKPRVLGEFTSPNEMTIPSSGFPPMAWTPLYSAPGFGDFIKNADLEKLGFSLEVSFIGAPRKTKDALTVGDFEISDLGETQATIEPVEPGLDPIFQRNIHVKGYLNPKNGQKVLFKSPGYPGLP